MSTQKYLNKSLIQYKETDWRDQKLLTAHAEKMGADSDGDLYSHAATFMKWFVDTVPDRMPTSEDLKKYYTT